MAKELVDRVAALEQQLGIKRAATRRPRTLTAEIEDVEKRIEAMGYMDDDVMLDAPVDDGMSFMDDDDVDDLGEPVEDFMDMDTEEVEDYCDDPTMASESKPGVEDEIDQDYLSEVVDLVRGGDSAVTDKSMLDVAKTGSEEYVVRMKRASARLDRVADHLQNTGRKKLAFKIDQISDAIDARIEGGRS